jgi:hypothetical protein
MEAIWMGNQDGTSIKDFACGIYVAVREITVQWEQIGVQEG